MLCLWGAQRWDLNNTREAELGSALNTRHHFQLLSGAEHLGNFPFSLFLQVAIDLRPGKSLDRLFLNGIARGKPQIEDSRVPEKSGNRPCPGSRKVQQAENEGAFWRLLDELHKWFLTLEKQRETSESNLFVWPLNTKQISGQVEFNPFFFFFLTISIF